MGRNKSQVYTAWKLYKYRVFSGLYFPSFNPNTLSTFHVKWYYKLLQDTSKYEAIFYELIISLTNYPIIESWGKKSKI